MVLFKVLHSICQQIWKTQQWKKSDFIPIPKKGNVKECSNYRTIVLISLASKVKVKVRSLSRVRLFATPWTAAYQAPSSMGFSRQEYWSGVWDECNCVVVWAFFGVAFLWDWNENGPFPVPWPLLSFQICWHIECSTFTASSFRIWNSSTGIPSPPLALFVVMLPKAHLTSHSRMFGSRWVITPSWLSWLWRSFFVQFFCVFLPPFLNIFCFR